MQNVRACQRVLQNVKMQFIFAKYIQAASGHSLIVDLYAYLPCREMRGKRMGVGEGIVKIPTATFTNSHYVQPGVFAMQEKQLDLAYCVYTLAVRHSL